MIWLAWFVGCGSHVVTPATPSAEAHEAICETLPYRRSSPYCSDLRVCLWADRMYVTGRDVGDPVFPNGGCATEDPQCIATAVPDAIAWACQEDSDG